MKRRLLGKIIGNRPSACFGEVGIFLKGDNDKMKKTGYEIIGMIKDGKAPKKIKDMSGRTYKRVKDGTKICYAREGVKSTTNYLNLMLVLNDEFEIIEEKVWRPEEDEEYWVIQCETIEKRYWNNDEDDIIVYNIGNYFKTKEEAEEALEKIKIYVRLKRYAEEHNTEKIDWNDLKQCKYNIYYAFDYKEFKIVSTYFYRDIGQIYFTSEEIARQATEEIGEENIKKLFEE